jgi:hypothetical protein
MRVSLIINSTRQGRMAFFIKAITSSGTESRDSTAYESVETAFAVIARDFDRGSIREAWIEDRTGQIAMDWQQILSRLQQPRP